MYRIDHPTAAATLPAVSAPGSPGFFQGGDPASGTPRTVVTQDWANIVQEELANVAGMNGAVLNKGDNTQVLKGVQASIFFAFTGSLAQSGYQRLPSGLILQWGIGDTVTGQGDRVNFPVAFPTAAFAAIANEANAAGWNTTGSSNPTIFGVSNLQQPFFQISCLRMGTGGTAYYVGGDAYAYFALGH